MALTGHLFIAVLVLIALTLFVLVLLDLPRARRRWARRSVRGVEVVTPTSWSSPSASRS